MNESERVVKIPVGNLRTTNTIPLDEEVVKEYQDLDPETRPPIAILEDFEDGSVYVIDGHHTLESAKRRGELTVRVEPFTKDEKLAREVLAHRRENWQRNQRGRNG